MKKGFTLAEVLITLGIIGVVATLTIPALIRSYSEKANVTSLLKFYSVLSDAVMQFEIDNGCDAGKLSQCLSGFGFLDNGVQNFEVIANYLKVTDKCFYSECADKAWLSDDSYNYFGENIGVGWGPAKSNYKTACYFLADTTVVCVDTNADSFYVYVDVNGKKSPNRVGQDIFGFLLGFKDGTDIYPEMNTGPAQGKIVDGLCTFNYCDFDNTDPNVSGGVAPTGYVIKNKKLLPKYK
jgi:prepilin-type N-terminal cleavage/methylation domain-containing protein